MIEKRIKIINLAKQFKKICEDNKIWYSLNAETLLGAVRHGGFVPWHEKFQVFVTVDGYNTLKRVASENIVDSSIDKAHNSLLVTFVEHAKTWKNAEAFLEISVAVPTTNVAVKHFKSKTRTTFKKLLGWKDNIKQAINDLYQPQTFEGYLLLKSRKDHFSKQWIQTLTLKTTTKKINDVEFNVALEWDTILKTKFGEDYMNATVPNVLFEYPSPLKKVRVE